MIGFLRAAEAPQAIRTDNGKEFCGRALLTWAHAHDVRLFLIEGPVRYFV